MNKEILQNTGKHLHRLNPKLAVTDCFAFLCLILFFSNTSDAHEYWLDPIEATVQVGDSVILDVRNGEEFSGAGMPFLPERYEGISVADKDTATEYKGRIGDYPAINTTLKSEGVHSITLTTKPSELTYESWDQFASFLSYHGLQTVVEGEDVNSYPRDNIKESYRRYTRAFVQATATGGTADREQELDVTTHGAFTAAGNDFEMLLINNPFANTDRVQVLLLKDQKPLAGRQAEMFWKGSLLLRFTELTDENGVASFKLPGRGEYLLNSVHLERTKNQEAHWESQWASITFEIGS